MRQDFWNQRYSEEELAYGFLPNRYLQEKASLMQPGMRVLAVGDGEGRNGIWLARRQLEVWSVDFSLTGLKKEQALSRNEDLSIRLLCADLANWKWPQNFFDAVVLIFVHFSPKVRKQIHHYVMNSLKSSGYLIMQSFQIAQLRYNSGGPRSTEMLYSPEQLRDDFAGMNIIELNESVEFLEEGTYHKGEAAVINLLAQRKI
jgi:cyclopropane fatty-acyl-phospholipid synthase-like methyltransferase